MFNKFQIKTKSLSLDLKILLSLKKNQRGKKKFIVKKKIIKKYAKKMNHPKDLN
jgi:hypothetical protein